MRSYNEVHGAIKDLRESKSKRYGSLEHPLKQINAAASVAGIDASQLVLARIFDKVNRLSIMIQAGEKSADKESLIDSAEDLANYAIFMVLALEQESELPIVEQMKGVMKDIRESRKPFSYCDSKTQFRECWLAAGHRGSHQYRPTKV